MLLAESSRWAVIGLKSCLRPLQERGLGSLEGATETQLCDPDLILSPRSGVSYDWESTEISDAKPSVYGCTYCSGLANAMRNPAWDRIYDAV